MQALYRDAGYSPTKVFERCSCIQTNRYSVALWEHLQADRQSRDQIGRPSSQKMVGVVADEGPYWHFVDADEDWASLIAHLIFATPFSLASCKYFR